MLKNLLFIEILIVVGSVIFHMASTKATRREVGHLPGIVLGVMAAIGYLAPSLIIAHIAIGLVPMIFGRTKLKVGMIVAMGIFAIPTLQINLTIGSIWLFVWSIQNSLAVGGLIAFMIATGRAAQAPPWADAAMVMVIAVLIVIDARGGAWVGFLRQAAMYLFVYAIPVYVITRSARNAVEWRKLLTAMAGFGLILAVIVLYEVRSTWPLYAPMVTRFGIDVDVIVKWRGGMMRAYGPMSEATNMGFVLVICFAAALAARRSFVSSTAYIAVASIVAVGSLAPQSRGGMIGLAVAFVVSSFYRRGIAGIGQLSLAGLFLSGAYATTMMIGSIGDQISTSLNEATGSGDYRTELLRRGMQEFWKSPLFGEDFAIVVARMQDMVQGEGIVDFVNTYLYIALFSGAIGLVIFCVAYIIPIGRLFQLRRFLSPATAERELAGFCLALLISAAVMLLFTSFLSRPTIFVLVACSAAMMVRVPARAITAKKQLDLRVSPMNDPIAA